MALRAAEIGPFTLSNNLLGTAALGQMPFFFLVWGFWAVQGFAHDFTAAVFFLI